jgi:phosphatidylglycerol lysyltransferase
MKERLAAAFGPLLGLVLFAAAALILRRELAEYHYRDVAAHLAAIPRGKIAASLGLAAVGYLSLTGYDALALRFVGRRLPYRRVALASFVAYVLSHNVGLAFVSGSAVRYRMFSTWGVTAPELGRAITFNVLTFWLGFLTLGALALGLAPLPLPDTWLPALHSTAPIGLLFALLLAAYLVATIFRPTLRVRGLAVTLPGPGTTLAQVLLSSIDWSLAACTLWVLVPETPGLGFPQLLAVFLLAQIAGLMSHVPAGLGVFETAMVLLLRPWLAGDVVLGSVLAFRLIYYLIPFSFGLVLFLAFEARERHRTFRAAGDWVGQWLPEIVPRAFAATTFAAGGLLLLSGATPAAPGRIEQVHRLLPLPLLELSHLLGSVAGVGLLLLARALQQRVDAAYGLTLTLLVGGAVASLGKGLDYEEAVVLLTMAAALAPCHRYFYRRSSLLAQSFSPGWIAAIALILAGTGFVVMLAYRHVDYSAELWWQFALDAHAPRSLRALAAGGLVLAGFAAARLLRPAPPLAPPATGEDAERAAKIVAASPCASAHLALLGDKRLLFHESGLGFVMFGVQRRSFVSMGDPVGPPEVRRELAWRFRELADLHGGLAVFYEVRAGDLPVYLDLGLRPRKLGEEARVPLTDFSLEGSARRELRQAQRRGQREGCRFEVVPREAVGPLLPELRAVSNQWLQTRSTREKRFSLGCFDESYLRRCPMALVRRGDRVVAFANVWAPDPREEVSVDLMRYSEDAPSGVMDYLFTELLLWGAAQGYRFFGLGMAPLSGFEHHRLAPLWNRLGALLFRHGEHFYNFQGLRAFKDKFDPVWEPRYLISPGGLSVPMVLTDVAALISGGVTGVVTR